MAALTPTHLRADASPAPGGRSNPVLLKDPQAFRRHAHPETKPRGGYVVHRRGQNRGDLIGRVRPTEHDSLEVAAAEADRLSKLHGREFTVFAQVYSTGPVASTGGR